MTMGVGFGKSFEMKAPVRRLWLFLQMCVGNGLYPAGMSERFFMNNSISILGFFD